MLKTPVNARTLKNHFAYSWWIYLAVLIAGTFVVDLLFTVTAPRIPEDKKVELYVYGYTDPQALNDYLENVRLTEMPDMEQMDAQTLTLDSTYGPMQLTTYMAAGEGDLYMLPREEFLSFSASGAFVALEEDQELMDFFTQAGKDLRRGWRTLNETDERHLFGIPLDCIPGLSQVAVAQDGFLSVVVNGGNTDNAMKLLKILCRDYISEPEPTPEPEPDPNPTAAP